MNLLTDCSGVDLETLAYPRHLHKGTVDYLRVDSAVEARAAVADGWRIDLVWPAPVPVPVVVNAPVTKGKK